MHAAAYQRITAESTATAATAPPRRASPLDPTVLPNLRVLDLSCNRLARVPPCLPPSLESLYLGTNLISELPRWLPAHLPVLQHLDVHMCNVLVVHGDVLRLTSLRMLAIAQNPVLRGGGALAAALRDGDTIPALRMRVQGMSSAEWRTELDSLRNMDADALQLDLNA